MTSLKQQDAAYHFYRSIDVRIAMVVAQMDPFHFTIRAQPENIIIC